MPIMAETCHIMTNKTSKNTAAVINCQFLAIIPFNSILLSRPMSNKLPIYFRLSYQK